MPNAGTIGINAALPIVKVLEVIDHDGAWTVLLECGHWTQFPHPTEDSWMFPNTPTEPPRIGEDFNCVECPRQGSRD